MNSSTDSKRGLQELPVYPEGSRLLRDDDRFWISRSIRGGLIVFLSLSETISVPSKLDVFKDLHLFADNRYKGTRILCELENTSIEERFIFVVKDIALKSVNISNESLFNHLYQQISEWSAFLRPRRQGIAHEELIGMWGEFYVLTQHVIGKISHIDALTSFVGPIDAPQDFLFSDKALEVKTTTKVSPVEISISSAEQLNCDRLKLGLAMIQIIESDDGYSLAYFLERMTELFNPDLPRLAGLWKKIHQKTEEASESQMNMRFSVIKERCWEVGDDFPKVTPTLLPYGVVKVKYAISISSLSIFENQRGIGGFLHE